MCARAYRRVCPADRRRRERSNVLCLRDGPAAARIRTNVRVCVLRCACTRACVSVLRDIIISSCVNGARLMPCERSEITVHGARTITVQDYRVRETRRRPSTIHRAAIGGISTDGVRTTIMPYCFICFSAFKYFYRAPRFTNFGFVPATILFCFTLKNPSRYRPYSAAHIPIWPVNAHKAARTVHATQHALRFVDPDRKVCTARTHVATPAAASRHGVRL